LRGTDGTTLRSSDTDTIKSLFICPEGKPQKPRTTSYLMRLVPGKDVILPDIICDNHRGIIIKATCIREDDGGYRYQVVEEVRQRGKR
jgi:hypothetical protein